METLLIDDDIEFSELLRQHMALYSINLTLSHTPSQALALLDQQRFDVILLDIMLPEMNGFELCQLIRNQSHLNQYSPLIMLTARNETVNMIVGLETGADDYVAKPFEPRELIARIYAVQRRIRITSTSLEGKEKSVVLGRHILSVNSSQVRVTVNEQMLNLTSSEVDLLARLIETPGEICLRAELESHLSSAQGHNYRSLDALIYRIRGKIRGITGDEEFIITIRAHGYMLNGVPNQEIITKDCSND